MNFHLLKMFVRYWQWFLLSVIICLCAAQLYLFRVTPAYRISGKLMISAADKFNPHIPSKYRNRYYAKHDLQMDINNVGTVSNTQGVETEVEVLRSSVLLRDVVKSLKLYTEYRVDDWPKKRTVYATQPVNVDLDEAHLDSIDRIMYEEYCSVIMKLGRKSDLDSTIIVRGKLLCDNEVVGNFSQSVKSLPAAITTPYGTVTLTHNPQGEPLTAGREWTVTIVPPQRKAIECMRRMRVGFLDIDDISGRRRRLYKMSEIVKLTYIDTDIRRGMDIIRQVAVSYNRQANSEKNKVALLTEAFINERLASLGDELGQKDRSISMIKRDNQLPSLADAARMMVEADKYSSKLVEAEAQSQMFGYLEEYVSNPENRYVLIPSNMGLSNEVTEKLINDFNELIHVRNLLLVCGASEEAPHVNWISSEADEISAAIRTALRQARQSAEIVQEGIGSQYAKYQRKTKRAPTMERELTDVGFQQRVKANLFELLLQKREENSIALAATADHGRLIDVPLVEGKVRPKWWKAHGIALAVGIGVPYAIFLLLGFLRYKLENRKELETLTSRPVIAEVPFVGEDAKDEAGIVVRTGVNDTINETFRFMRSNIFFMLKGEGNTMLFTSSTSGEGKTFNAANLAMSYAMMDKRVVLCGLDIRKPALGGLFGLADKGRGISILLRQDEVTEEDVRSQIQPSGIDEHLDLLLAGPIPPNPTELLARDCFGKVMAVLKQAYDYVILDTAPVGLVTDTLQIGRYADVTVFVCRAYYTPTNAINQLNALSEENKLPNTCFVLNGVESTSNSWRQVM